MKTKKSTAFWASFIALVLLFALTAIKAPQSLDGVGSTIVIAIAMAGGLYQAANVADNWQRSKFYRPELDERTPPSAAGAEGEGK
jgi:hypothetical protein